MYDDAIHGAGIITGIGKVAGRDCVIVCNDATIKGGTYYPMTVKKHLRAQEIAADNRLPCLYLVDSGGANLPHQAEVFPDRDHFGRIFFNQARLSAAGIAADRHRPRLVHGGRRLCAGDVGRGDHRQGRDHLPRRPAAGEGGDRADRLGRGSRRRRRAYAAFRRRRPLCRERRRRRCERARKIVAGLGARQPARTSISPRRSSRGCPAELDGIIPVDRRLQYDVREIIGRLVDGSDFDEFKARYATTLVTGFARLAGIPVGIVANNGILFSESALKGAHFIELCCQRRIPLLFLQNIAGFMVGRDVETRGIAKDGAKLVAAVANAAVPKITLIIGGSFGAGNYGMAGRAFSPRFLFTWPNARISVMGGEQAASVLAQVKRDNLAAEGKSWSAEEEAAFKAPISRKYEDEGNPYYATARLWDDGIIAPEETRGVLAHALRATLNAPIPETRWGVWRM